MKGKLHEKVFFLFIRFVIKFSVVYSFLIMLLIFGVYLFGDIFIFHREKSIPLTYYGFAIFAALSNICFSYSRNCDSKEQIFLTGIGERFLFSSIVFLIGSILNYININSKSSSNYSSFIYSISFYSAGSFFMGAFFHGGGTIYVLLDHLFEKITLNKENYIE